MRYGRDFDRNQGIGMNRGMDVDRGGWDRGGNNRSYDMDYNAGYRGGNQTGFGMDRDNFRGRGMTNFNQPTGGYDAGFRGGPMRGGHTRELGMGERVVFRPRHGYDRDFGNRDFGDRLQSGWNRLENNVRDFFDRDDRNRGRGW